MNTSSAAIFLQNGGRMGEAIRDFDWAATPLGPPEQWPSPLRTAVGLMLGAAQPVYVAYGPELTSLYNDGYLPIVGEKHPEGLGAPYATLWAEIWDEFKPIVEATMAGEAQHFVNLPIALAGRPGLPVGYFTFSYTALRDDDGRAVGFYCAATETTEQVEQAQRMAENEALLEHALSKGRGIGAWDWDVPNDRVFADQRFAALYGVDPEWARIGAPIGQFFAGVHPDDLARLQAGVAEGLKTGAAFSAEYRLLQPDGSSRWVIAEGRCHLSPGGAPLRFLGISFDITEQKADAVRREALAAIADAIRDIDDPETLVAVACAILGQALDTSRVAFGAVDPDSEILTVTRDWRASGVDSVANVLNLRSFGNFVDDLKRGDFTVVSDVTVDARTAAAAEALATRGVGALAGAPVLEQGRLAAMLYVVQRQPRNWTSGELDLVQDVAERLRTAVERLRGAEALRASHETLESRVEERTRDLMVAQEALRQSQKLEAIGQLTGGVAHDFNNLLTVIRGSIDMLRRADLTEARRERYVDAIGDASDRAAKLTGQLLAFARRQTLRPETFDVRDSLAAVLEVVRSLSGSRIEITPSVPATPCWVRADRSQFDTAIVNIAVNARDAMGGEGRIAITVCAANGIPAVDGQPAVDGDFIAVVISDAGPGIALHDLPKIFDPFFTTKAIGAGTGLGLSQVIGFAKQSDGEVRAANGPGGGAVFTLYLPSVPAPVEGAASEAEAPNRAGGDGVCVLVVEDNPQVGEFATHALNELGYDCLLARSGADALARLAEDCDRFHIVFSDVVMPGMSGLDLAAEIGRLYPDVPVILSSGYSHVLAENDAYDIDLLPKPYSIDQLSASIRGALMRVRPL